MKIVAGTDKGLVVFERTTTVWEIKKIHFLGYPVGAICLEDSKWWVGINHKHWGPKIHVSEDQGKSWTELNTPKFGADMNFALRSIWSINYQNDTLLIGTEPAGLFASDDGGHHYREITGLHHHPSRHEWMGGGKGSNNPFLHTTLIDHSEAKHWMVGISCAGIFRSLDNGATWNPSNTGMESFYPSKSDVGYDPHCIKQSLSNPDVFWQQNHCGVYRSTDRGKTWSDVSPPESKYGFALGLSANDPLEAWIIPAESDDLRIPSGGILTVLHTTDGGVSWMAQTNGLPKTQSFDLVFRDAFDLNGNQLSFGTNNGNLYFSANKGQDWDLINVHLSPIRSLRIR
ncbi:MAG: hypothetical protein JXQ90_06450 [Cyclobacteriaceae bacterium]